MFFSYVRCSLKEQSFRLSMLSTIFYNLEKKLLYQTRLIVKSLVFWGILPMLPVPSCCSNLFLEKGPFPFISSLDSVYFSSICNNMAFTRWWRYLMILWQYADNWTSWIDQYINISCNVYGWLDGYFNIFQYVNISCNV